MSNSQQLKCNKSRNYWIMDKTKGAEGNLHIKERTESRILGLKSKISFFFILRRIGVKSRRVRFGIEATSQLHYCQLERDT